MKPLKRSLLLLGTAIVLSACGLQDDTASEPDGTIAEQKESIYATDTSNTDHYLSLVERADPTWAGITYASHTGSTSTDYIAEIEDEESLQFIVEEMIEGSNREPGIVDMSQPYYDMKIEYEDGSEELFHLWVTEDEMSGTLMDSENTHYIYTFSEDVSERFLSLLPEDAILETPRTADWIDGKTFGLSEVIAPDLETDIDTLIRHSEYIVQGNYTSADSSDVPESWGDESMVYYSFDVQDVLKGDLDMDVIEVGQPDHFLTWAREPETGEDLGTVRSENPFISKPDPEKNVILFLSMQNEPGEFWRFTEPTMVEVMSDGSLRSVSTAFDDDFDSSKQVEVHELPDDWTLELTIEFPSETLPVDDPFELITRKELLNRINLFIFS